MTGKIKYVDQQQLDAAAEETASLIVNKVGTSGVIYGVPRGGIPAAYLVLQKISKLYGPSDFRITSDPSNASVIVDDLIDSGRTKEKFQRRFPNTPFFALITKLDKDSWYVFPWEETEHGSADDIPIRLLEYIGENPKRGGLIETPSRFLKAWKDWTEGYHQDPKEVLKVFKDGAENCDQMILVKDNPISSHCEHHLAPFFGTVSVAYIPDKHIIGLSKIPRVINIYAKRLQVQERLTNQIANALWENLKPQGVAVYMKCRHMCMESRGIRQIGSHTVTSALRGAFKDNVDTRIEFFNLVNGE